MTATSSHTPTTTEFEPPGPGSWERDISHATPAPTRLYRRLTATVMPDAYREVFANFGGPIDTLDVRWVHGAMYLRIVPLVAADSERPPPPRPIMWALLRLHPAFRRREKAARHMWSDRPDQRAVAEWYRAERQSWIDRNRALQDIDLVALDDAALADHVDEAEAHLFTGWRRHHVLHGSDVGPIGDLLVHARSWGLSTDEVLSMLKGASPATTAAATTGRRIADALADAGVDPATVTDLEQVRAVPAASQLLDDYLSHAGWQVATSYDIEAATIGELPSVVCAIVRGHARSAGVEGASERTLDGTVPHQAAPRSETIEQLRDRVPTGERVTFDELVERARTAYGLRDDNGPLTAEWPMGLARRAVLEAGRRLHAAGRLAIERHVFELDLPEIAAVLRGAASPTVDEIVARAADRLAEAQLDPPATLGPESAEPPMSVFPPGIRRTMEVVVTALSLTEVDPASTAGPLEGLGIGDRPHRGRARLVADQERIGEVFDAMAPGDVLVAPWTAPTFNPLFSVAGAVVVREGGPLSHAAVMSRELGIPAVIGCRGAMDAISDGDLIEVDPVAGRVTILPSG